MALLSHSHTLPDTERSFVHRRRAIHLEMARTKHVYRRSPSQLGLLQSAEQTASRKRSRRGAPSAALARGSPRRRLSDSPPEPASRPQTPPGLAPPTAIRLAARCPPPSGGETTLVAGPQWTKPLSPRSSAALARLAAGKPPPPAPRCAACNTLADSGPQSQGLRRHPTLPVCVCSACLAAIRTASAVRHCGPLVRSQSSSRRPQRPRSKPETGVCYRRSSCACWRSTASVATPRADSRAHQQKETTWLCTFGCISLGAAAGGRPAPPHHSASSLAPPLPSPIRFRA